MLYPVVKFIICNFNSVYINVNRCIISYIRTFNAVKYALDIEVVIICSPFCIKCYCCSISCAKVINTLFVGIVSACTVCFCVPAIKSITCFRKSVCGKIFCCTVGHAQICCWTARITVSVKFNCIGIRSPFCIKCYCSSIGCSKVLNTLLICIVSSCSVSLCIPTCKSIPCFCKSVCCKFFCCIIGHTQICCWTACITVSVKFNRISICCPYCIEGFCTVICLDKGCIGYSACIFYRRIATCWPTFEGIARSCESVCSESSGCTIGMSRNICITGYGWSGLSLNNSEIAEGCRFIIGIYIKSQMIGTRYLRCKCKCLCLYVYMSRCIT